MKSKIKRLESNDEAKKYEVLEEVVRDLTHLTKSLKEAAEEMGRAAFRRRGPIRPHPCVAHGRRFASRCEDILGKLESDGMGRTPHVPRLHESRTRASPAT